MMNYEHWYGSCLIRTLFLQIVCFNFQVTSRFLVEFGVWILALLVIVWCEYRKIELAIFKFNYKIHGLFLCLCCYQFVGFDKKYDSIVHNTRNWFLPSVFVFSCLFVHLGDASHAVLLGYEILLISCIYSLVCVIVNYII